MTIDCVQCGRHTADRIEFEKYHTTWLCAACGCRFQHTLRGVVVREPGTHDDAGQPAEGGVK